MTTTLDHAPATRTWGLAFAVWACGLAAFQLALALGAPWGEAAWGGQTEGVLPAGLRVGSAVSTVVWLGVAAIAAGRLLGPTGRRRTLLGVTIYSAAGIALNALSPSATERAIWVPGTVLGTALAWMAWREARAARP
ncbi:MAG TPA: hypothetical protein VLW53_13495 [Candidatus Eisenbacteria bacterium]|nr:hypothetical protein [Candidatus Eisenbacteria bacterium]